MRRWRSKMEKRHKLMTDGEKNGTPKRWTLSICKVCEKEGIPKHIKNTLSPTIWKKYLSNFQNHILKIHTHSRFQKCAIFKFSVIFCWETGCQKKRTVLIPSSPNPLPIKWVGEPDYSSGCWHTLWKALVKLTLSCNQVQNLTPIFIKMSSSSARVTSLKSPYCC